MSSAQKDAASTPQRRSRLFHYAFTCFHFATTPRYALPIAAISLFILSFLAGLGNKMPGVMPQAVDKHNVSIAIAISEMKYKLHDGYVAYREVLNALETNGMSKNPQILAKAGIAFPENLTDLKMQNEAIAASLNLEHPEKQGKVHLYAEEIGYVDFCKLGFWVFGYKLESLYYAFFLVTGISLLLFIAEYRGLCGAMTIVVLVQAMMVLVIVSMPYVDRTLEINLELGSVINGRFLGVVGIVAFLHLGFFAAMSRTATPWTISRVALQTCVMLFAINMRSSALWMVIALFLLTAIWAARWTWSNRKSLPEFPLRQLGRAALAGWPIAVVAGGYLMLVAYQSLSRNWVYGTDDALPHHFQWHNAYIGLSFHPKFGERIGNKDFPVGDATTYDAVRSFLAAEGAPPNFQMSTLDGGYRPGLHDKIAKTLFLRFVRHNPGFMFELLLVKKSVFIEQYRLLLDRWTSTEYGGRIRVLLTALLIWLSVVVWRNVGVAEMKAIMAVIASGAMVSLLPLFWAYPSRHVMTEQTMVITALGATGVWAAVIWARAVLVKRFAFGKVTHPNFVTAMNTQPDSVPAGIAV